MLMAASKEQEQQVDDSPWSDIYNKIDTPIIRDVMFLWVLVGWSSNKVTTTRLARTVLLTRTFFSGENDVSVWSSTCIIY